MSDVHDEVYPRLLTRALRDPEIVAALAEPGAPSADELRRAAGEHRAFVLAQARAAEEEWRRAEADLRATRRRRRLKRLAAWVSWCVAVVLVLASFVATAWADRLQAAYGEHRAVEVGEVLEYVLYALLGLAVIVAAVAFVVWWGYLVMAEAPSDGSPDEIRRLKVTVTTTAVVAFLLSAFWLGEGASDIAWQFTTGHVPGDDDRYAWEWLVVLGTLAVYGAACTTALEELQQLDRDDEVTRLATVWQETLRESLLGFLRGEISGKVTRPHAVSLSIGAAPGLSNVRSPDVHVRTAAEAALLSITDAMAGGSVALAGPRGVGKTELLKELCNPARKNWLSVEVMAPVAYDRREFMLHLLEVLCRRVRASGLKTAALAERELRRVRSVQTRSNESNANLGWSGFGVSMKRGTSLAHQPMTYPEIVNALRTLLRRVAAELHDAPERRRLVVGVDELDRIAPATAARDFLNELKAVFDVPHCLFVLSVSDEALREADLAPLGRRDAFDSAIDEVVRVDPLDYETSVRLLDTRVVGLPAPFSALFHCLSGGSPRDLLRMARAAIARVTPERPCPLSEVTAALVGRELERVANSAVPGGHGEELLQLFHAPLVAAHGGLGELAANITRQAALTPGGDKLGATLANRAHHLDTISGIFTDDLTEAAVTAAADPDFPGSFAALARAQREIGRTDVLARSSLQRIRAAWGLAALPETG
ncbi:hypothetical protein GCM10010149_14800 [Nonomuraea roseoviolacea subsp. roseoviolacea]|uniref:AAA family ATPase n=1 Tax=Nonomuraea roseoviolacea TaxID=103837 RepID=UPI0031D85F4D